MEKKKVDLTKGCNFFPYCEDCPFYDSNFDLLCDLFESEDRSFRAVLLKLSNEIQFFKDNYRKMINYVLFTLF